ncbi:MAG TPA: 3-keto-5-aminohexanoate cleavage protein [Baekduia sp.]|nr:3-keto-5-aminohexanoate cleavage protein [Baekduia sp.]
MEKPCIIEVALNGATTKDVNPHVPRSPAEITADALACIEAGASVVHNHNDEFLFAEDGVHAASPYREAWRPVLDVHPDALFYATMASGGPGISIETRWGHQVELAQEGLLRVGLVDPGSVSLGLLDEHGLPYPVDLVYVNTFADARYMVERCAELRLAPSISIFDPSFLRVALAFYEAGALPPGALIKFYFGGDIVPFGLPPTEASLDAYVAMLEGTGLEWQAAVLGGDVISSGVARAALERGGHVRVGLEDYAGPRTPMNAELVEELHGLIETSGRRVATIAETHKILGIPAG